MGENNEFELHCLGWLTLSDLLAALVQLLRLET